MVLIRFLRSFTKKDSVESAKYERQFFFYFYSSFRMFFSRIRIFPDRIRIFGRYVTGLRIKNLIRIRGKKTGSETLQVFYYY